MMRSRCLLEESTIESIGLIRRTLREKKKILSTMMKKQNKTWQLRKITRMLGVLKEEVEGCWLIVMTAKMNNRLELRKKTWTMGTAMHTGSARS